MDFKGLMIKEEIDKVLIENVVDFDPVHIFECGQCFRWIREKDGSFTGVAKGKVVNVKVENGKLIISNSDFEDFKNIWFDYFDLGRDYSDIKKKLSLDEHMSEAIKYGQGIRILKQDLWETLISFIISVNNRIPRIMKIIDVLSTEYGTKISFKGKDYYTFPEMEVLTVASIEELGICKWGYRCKYIHNTANLVKQGLIDLKSLEGLSTASARTELTKLSGVGDKVADCTLLYSGTKQDVFPTDVWVKRVMETLYFKKDTSFKDIQAFSDNYFGSLAGFAQQYLFYYARGNRIGVK